MSEKNPDYIHEKVQGIDVITFSHRVQADLKRIARIKKDLCDLVDGRVDRMVLDFTNVECICSEFIGMLLTLRKHLSVKKPFRDYRSRNWEGFEICPDQQTALDAILSPEADPLVFCCVIDVVRACFRVTGRA